MRKALVLHPESRCDAVTGIVVEVTRQDRTLSLTFVVTGAIGDLYVPAVTVPARTDGLWERTCFEVFARASPSRAYREFNFAPSGQWAAYRFDSYREGMAVAREIAAPHIEVRSTAERFELQASLESIGLAANASGRLALSAVIEEMNGRKSYWALAHPAGKPDFHDAAGFALDLPTA